MTDIPMQGVSWSLGSVACGVGSEVRDQRLNRSKLELALSLTSIVSGSHFPPL